MLAYLIVVFILDTGKEVYVWIGRGASDAERKNGLPYAHVCNNLLAAGVICTGEDIFISFVFLLFSGVFEVH